ncbi:putative sulfate/molybdate transporter [Franzmannia qiaohouensis]|uniref:Sulfate/molybdate transporter n=1 Tax=Franzmannia qiaohouensis TaxID=1329370 RepID=A0ABU1HBS8_9GAMM|nr:putative sulfate/molybdate transporter [Halomonas qiaohouensis]MDR5904923.1 putative sulfate/molybdate transporter [Halomonas qiaohouensis]
MSLDLMASAPLIAMVTLVLLAGLLVSPRYPATLVALAAATLLAQALDVPGMIFGTLSTEMVSLPVWPSLAEIERAIAVFVLPQLSLTFTNAVLLTALLAGDYFGARSSHVTPVRLSISSGLANLFLTPWGALPMCHGAGGLAAHYRFGARSGAAPLMIGVALIAFSLLPGKFGLTILAAIPAAGLGALLLVTAGQLAATKRLLDCKPACWPVIAVTAGVTVVVDPFWGLLVGAGAEAIRKRIVCALVK